MNRRVLLLRACYWFGAIVDAVAVIPMLFPSAAARVFGIDNFHPGVEYRYAMFLAASLMLGWTALLLWADRRPVERAAVLALTVCPVVLGLAAAGVFAVWEGLITAARMLPTWIVQAALAAGLTYAYRSRPTKDARRNHVA
jgi:hypothetical protein